ncbi:hypothetical protein V5799_029699 [Amblyomma americanum]|uniref:Uncharacterized protein n=1 Tax=Amblyomma americanum TaxID=6943 RepID=A0AAQ4EQB4_AMBAM
MARTVSLIVSGGVSEFSLCRVTNLTGAVRSAVLALRSGNHGVTVSGGEMCFHFNTVLSSAFDQAVFGVIGSLLCIYS